jgi:hypothetical protein
MIARCLRHQWPEDFGGTWIGSAPPLDDDPTRPTTGPLEPVTGFALWPLTEWCARCGCSHGAPPEVAIG